MASSFLRLQVQNVDCFVGRKPIFLLEVNHFFRPASALEHTFLNLLVASSSGLMLVPVSGDDRPSVRATSEVWERKRVTQTCSSTARLLISSPLTDSQEQASDIYSHLMLPFFVIVKVPSDCSVCWP